MLRRLLCILLTLCLLLGYAAAEDTASAAPTQEPPEGALVNGMVDGAGESAVQGLQQRLIDLGLLTGEADGHFGDGTEDAVEVFQQMYGLEATGYADEETLSALSAAQVGVLDVQEWLIAAGVLNGAADGVLGEGTEKAISTFQQTFGLEPTGVADPETRELLSNSSNVIFGVQTKLIELAYLTGVADGVLGPATETAIREFQEMHGLEATGVADPETRELLQNGTDLTVKPTPTPSPRAHGSQGTDIELSQQRLAEWGFLSGSVDGHYGDDTEDAVKEFKTYQYDDYLAYLEANPTPSPEPTPTPTPAPTPTLAPGEMPVVVDATLPPTPSPTPTPAPYDPDGKSPTACWTSLKTTRLKSTARPCATAIRARRWSVCSAACISSSTCTAPTAPLAISRRTLSSTSSARTTLTKPAWPTNPRRGFCSAPTPSRARNMCSPTSWWWISPTAAPTSTAGRATVTMSASTPSSAAWARPRRRRRRAPSRAPGRRATLVLLQGLQLLRPVRLAHTGRHTVPLRYIQPPQ